MEALRNLFIRLFPCVSLKPPKKQLDDDGFDFPTEIITEEIISRLPVKSIIRFRSVSKPWLSRISDPSFVNHQLAHATTALIIPAVDRHTGNLLMFTANCQGGSLTRLTTLERVTIPYGHVADSQHLNGLVLLTFHNPFNYHEAIVVNPITHKTLKLGYGVSKINHDHPKYFFGFDESTNKHKVLRISGFGSTPTIEMIVLSRSNYSWTKIDDATFHIGKKLWAIDIKSGVCVNSVIHMMLRRTTEILVFDLRTNSFSILKVPLDDDMSFNLTMNHFLCNPYLIKINECIGVVCSHRVIKTNEMHIWILKDYEHHVWVKETVIFPESWRALGCPDPLDSVSADEIIFSVTDSKNVINSLIYNMRSGCFKSVSFTLDRSLPGLKDSKGLRVHQIKCYLESIVPVLAT